MRFSPRVSRLALTASMFLVAACAVSQSRITRPAGSRPVQVKVKCSNNSLDVSVRPFTIVIGPGESVFWQPESKFGGIDRNDVAVTIVPKDTANWPFATARPTMPPDSGVSSGPLLSTKPDTVSYNLRFTCNVDGVSRLIEVDPDIIIKGGSTQ